MIVEAMTANAARRYRPLEFGYTAFEPSRNGNGLPAILEFYER
jgi:hypothetical protein